jgi:hypothetical protein
MNIPQELERAKAAIREKDQRKARSILRKVIEAEPRNLEAWLLFADVAQKPEHTVQCLERVLKLDPGNLTASRRLGRLLPPSPETGGDNPGRQEKPQPGEIKLPLPSGGQPPFDRSADWESAPPEPANIAALSPGAPAGPPVQPAAPGAASFPSAKKKASGGALEKLLLAVIGLLLLCVVCGLGYAQLSRSLTGLAAARPTPAPADYAAVIYENIRAANAEDLAAYMATIHPNSPAYATTQELLKKSFETYDLSYAVSGVAVVEENSQEVSLSFILVTRKIRGPSFRDNKISGVMILHKDGEVWKIYDQKIDNIQYLN